jgi:hypothetical protein
VLQCSGLASGEWRVISDVREWGRGSLVVRVCELFMGQIESGRVGFVGVWGGSCVIR